MELLSKKQELHFYMNKIPREHPKVYVPPQTDVR